MRTENGGVPGGPRQRRAHDLQNMRTPIVNHRSPGSNCSCSLVAIVFFLALTQTQARGAGRIDGRARLGARRGSQGSGDVEVDLEVESDGSSTGGEFFEGGA